MNIKKIESGGVWVKASEETMQEGHWYQVKYGEEESEQKVICYVRVGQNSHITHWLKSIKDVYVLTEDEMESFYNKAVTEGIYSLKRPGKYFKDFIESITKQQGTKNEY